MKKPPAKKHHEAFADHNAQLFLKNMAKVQKAIRKLDCAVAECGIYAGLAAPSQKKGARK